MKFVFLIIFLSLQSLESNSHIFEKILTIPETNVIFSYGLDSKHISGRNAYLKDMILPKVPGIYQIRNIIDNKIYVGSAINIYSRNYNHFRDLKRQKHHNAYLQRAYNKHCKENFIFEILELVPQLLNETKKEFKLRLMNEREQHYLDTLLFAQEYISSDKKDRRFRELGYNTNPLAHSSLGYTHSIEDRKNMSFIQKNRNYIQSPESIQKGLDTKRGNGNWYPSEETIKKRADSLRGNKHDQEWCDKNSVSMNLMYLMQRRPCNFCKKMYSAIKAHELRCKSNPDRVDLKFRKESCDLMSIAGLAKEKIYCEFCTKDIDPGNYAKHHGEFCKENPNRTLVECPHCLKKVPNGNSKRHHFDNCKFKNK